MENIENVKKLNLKPFDLQKASPSAQGTEERRGLFALIGLEIFQ